MYPILLQFGPIKIYSYGLLVALAFIVSTYLLKAQAQRRGLLSEKIFNLCLYVAISGILGARLLYVLQNLNFYLQFPQEIFMLHKGGLSFYGGFILAIISAVIFLKSQKMPVLGTFDLICPYLALAQAIGRIGCFFKGCCFGAPTSSFLAVYFPGEDIGRHPVQIYSSLSLLAIFIILKIAQDRRPAKFSGESFLLYCLLFSAMRFFMEYLRGDNLRVFANLTLHQLISLGIFIIAWIIWKKNETFSS